MSTSTLPLSETKMEITENSEELQKLEDTKCLPGPSSEIGIVIHQNVQPILSQENIHNGKPRKIHLTIVESTHRKDDNDPNSLVEGDINKSISSYLTADNILDQNPLSEPTIEDTEPKEQPLNDENKYSDWNTIFDRKCETFENVDCKATCQDLEIENDTSKVLDIKSNKFDGKYLKVEKVEKLNSPKKIEASQHDDEVFFNSKYMDFDLKCATSFFEFLGLKKIPPKEIEVSYDETKLSKSYDTCLDEPYLKIEKSDTDGLTQGPGIIHERPKGLTDNDVSLKGHSPPFHGYLQTTFFPTNSENDSNSDISRNDKQKHCELSSTTEKEQIGGVATENDLLKDKYNQNDLLMAMKKEIEVDNMRLEPFYVGEVLLNVIGDLSAHTVVVLGDVRLSEKDAKEKIKEYENCLQKKKERLLHPNGRYNKPYAQSTLHRFECKQCDYRSSSIRNWRRHRKTQRHQILVGSPPTGNKKERTKNLTHYIYEGYSKGKRVRRCGECEGCSRDDCGKCNNCLDKPKFGGKHIMKKACTMRKCHTKKRNVDYVYGRSTKAKKVRRCGVCKGCTRYDCGECICCLDKTKFGGKSTRKEACKLKKCRRKKKQVDYAYNRSRRANYVRRCGECEGCTRDNCRECISCLDKATFGGKNIRKEACKMKKCVMK